MSVAPDATAASNAVQQLVTDANTVLSDIQTNAGYNAQTKTAGPLMGSAVLQTRDQRGPVDLRLGGGFVVVRQRLEHRPLA